MHNQNKNFLSWKQSDDSGASDLIELNVQLCCDLFWNLHDMTWNDEVHNYYDDYLLPKLLIWLITWDF